jgi:hypothetical protein
VLILVVPSHLLNAEISPELQKFVERLRKRCEVASDVPVIIYDENQLGGETVFVRRPMLTNSSSVDSLGSDEKMTDD